MNVFLSFDLVAPAVAIAAGIAIIVFPRRHRERAQLDHSARIAELEAGAEDAFFEERRSLEAYRPAKTDRGWRLLGAVIASVGIVRAVLLFFD